MLFYLFVKRKVRKYLTDCESEAIIDIKPTGLYSQYSHHRLQCLRPPFYPFLTYIVFIAPPLSGIHAKPLQNV